MVVVAAADAWCPASVAMMSRPPQPVAAAQCDANQMRADNCG